MVSLQDFCEQSTPRDIPRRLRRRVLFLGGYMSAPLWFCALFVFVGGFFVVFFSLAGGPLLLVKIVEAIVSGHIDVGDVGLQVGLAFSLFSGATLFGYKFLVRRNIYLLERGVISEGLVVGWEEVETPDGGLVYIKVQFFDGSVDRTESVCVRPKCVALFPNGTTVKVLYDAWASQSSHRSRIST